jgi:hypothetical protein
MPSEALDDDDVNMLVLLALSLQQELGARSRIHCDLSSAQAMAANRAQFAALTDPSTVSDRMLSSMINPLVLKEDGVLRPFMYDFPPVFDIGRAGPGLVESIEHFRNGGCRRLALVLTETFNRLETQTGFVDRYDYCRRLAEELAADGYEPRSVRAA